MSVDNKKIDLEEKLLIEINHYQLEFFDDLLDKKNRINIRIASLSLQRDEILKHLKQNEENSDINYTFFSPNDLGKLDETKKIKTELKVIERKINGLERKLNEISEWLKRFELVQKYIQLLERKVNNTYEPSLTDMTNDSEINYYKHSGLLLLKAQEFERKRIAIDLHDLTLQDLTSLVHKTELCSKLIDLDINRSRLELEAIQNNISAVISDMRNIIYDLRPMVDENDFLVAIKRLIKSYNNVTDSRIELHINNYNTNILSIINITLYRIIQEACINSIKHSNAENIKITITYNEDSIYLYIEDDGVGFNMNNTGADDDTKVKHFGLSIMRDRVLMLSGMIEINTKENIGTKINIVVPLIMNLEG